MVGESFEQNVAGSCEPACWTYFKDPDVQASVSVATYTPAVDQSKVPYNKSAPKALHGLAHLGISIKNQKAMPDADGIPGTGQPGSPVYHGGAGARNRGMGNEGLYFEGGKEYEGYLYFSVGAPAPPVPGVPPPPPPLLEVALEGDSLRTLAAQRFVLNYTNGTEWNKLSFSLTPNETTSCVSGAGDLSVYCGTYEGLPSAGHTCIKCGGSFRLRLLRGSVGVDFVTLMPGAWGRLHDKSGKPLPVLKSGADVLQQMGTQIIRQGGARETQTILRSSMQLLQCRCLTEPIIYQDRLGTTMWITYHRWTSQAVMSVILAVGATGTLHPTRVGTNGRSGQGLPCERNPSFVHCLTTTPVICQDRLGINTWAAAGPGVLSQEFRPTVGAHWVNSLLGGWGPLCVVSLCSALLCSALLCSELLLLTCPTAKRNHLMRLRAALHCTAVR